jgi:hypothetical protein
MFGFFSEVIVIVFFVDNISVALPVIIQISVCIPFRGVPEFAMSKATSKGRSIVTRGFCLGRDCRCCKGVSVEEYPTHYR